MTKKEILRMEHITKYFYTKKALDDARFNLFEGEIMGIMGLNLSGKSTLAKIIAGIVPADEGAIYFNDRQEKLNFGYTNSRHGIYYICRDSTLFPKMTIRKNIFSISTAKKYDFIINKRKEKNLTNKLLKQFDIDFEQNTLLRSLSLDQIHLIHICRALAINSRIIILDDITGTYNREALKRLMNAILKLQDQGVSVIYINNRLDDVFSISDRITIFENGRNLWTLSKDQYSKDKVLKILSGGKAKLDFNRPQLNSNDEVFSVKHLSLEGIVNSISFKLRSGEILGLAIDDEITRNKLGEVLFGLEKKTSGEIYVNQKRVRLADARTAMKYGIGFIPEQSYQKGFFENMDIEKNIAFFIPRGIRRFFRIIDLKLEKYVADLILEAIGLNNDNQDIDELTDLQKIKLSIQKWMIMKPKILISINPVLGFDIIAKEQVNTIIKEIAHKGIAVILISSDIYELIEMSDRIILFEKETIKCEFNSIEAIENRFITSN